VADRADLIARVKALRARAGDTASSEAEAEAAARIAAKIIAEHELTEAELRERGTGGIAEGVHNDGRARLHPALERAAFEIGQLTECAALTRRGANVWVGQPADVAFAIYLCELIEGAAERAYKAHWRRVALFAPSAHYRQSFMAGFGTGIAHRLSALTERRKNERRATGASSTSLVTVKSAIIESYLSETRPPLRERRIGRRKEPHLGASLSGLTAADRVNLSRPIEGQATDKLKGTP
jgi:hypothetical protein